MENSEIDFTVYRTFVTEYFAYIQAVNDSFMN